MPYMNSFYSAVNFDTKYAYTWPQTPGFEFGPEVSHRKNKNKNHKCLFFSMIGGVKAPTPGSRDEKSSELSLTNTCILY